VFGSIVIGFVQVQN